MLHNMTEQKYLKQLYFELRNEKILNEYTFEKKQKAKSTDENYRTIHTDQSQLKNKNEALNI